MPRISKNETVSQLLSKLENDAYFAKYAQNTYGTQALLRELLNVEDTIAKIRNELEGEQK